MESQVWYKERRKQTVRHSYKSSRCTICEKERRAAGEKEDQIDGGCQLLKSGAAYDEKRLKVARKRLESQAKRQREAVARVAAMSEEDKDALMESIRAKHRRYEAGLRRKAREKKRVGFVVEGKSDRHLIRGGRVVQLATSKCGVLKEGINRAIKPGEVVAWTTSFAVYELKYFCPLCAKEYDSKSMCIRHMGKSH